MDQPPDLTRQPPTTRDLSSRLSAWTRFIAIVPAFRLIVGATVLILVGAPAFNLRGAHGDGAGH